jgi:transposase-like protein
VVINLLANVKQKTIAPFIKDTIVPGTLVYTDEYSIYARLSAWGYSHKSVNHGRGEYARDEDRDGFYEVHCIRWRAFGRSCGVGFARTRVFHRRNSRCTWVSSSLYTMSESEAKRYLVHSLSSWLHKTLESTMSD